MQEESMKQDNQPEQETLGDKWDRLSNTVTNIGQKVTEAIQEEKRKYYELSCVQKESLNFSLVEKDIQAIHQQLEQDGSKVLGSYLILDDKKDVMEIQTYKQQDEKTLVNTVKVTVHKVKNIPRDVNMELKQKRYVKLYIKQA